MLRSSGRRALRQESVIRIRRLQMRGAITGLLAAVAIGSFSAPVLLQEKGGDDRTGPYDVVQGWPLPLALAKPGYIWGSTGGIFAESPNRIFIANRGELKLPDKLPPNFTGFWRSFGEQATPPTPEFRNCIVVVDDAGRALESCTQWAYLVEDGRGPHSVLMSPYGPERRAAVQHPRQRRSVPLGVLRSARRDVELRSRRSSALRVGH